MCGGDCHLCCRDGFVALDDEHDEQFKRRGETILKNEVRFEELKTSGPSLDHLRNARGEGGWHRHERSMEHLTDLDIPILMLLPP